MKFDMVALETVNNQYLGGDTSLACSAQTQCEIDQKVVELVKAQHEKAVQILTDNRAKAGRAGTVSVPEGDHHRRRIHGDPEPGRIIFTPLQ